MWARIETGTVYHAWEPSLTVGFATSPNMSRGTGHPPASVSGTGPRIIVRAKKQCQRNLLVVLDTVFREMALLSAVAGAVNPGRIVDMSGRRYRRTAARATWILIP
jgi:hypothetical protein